MITNTKANFEHDKVIEKLATLLRQAEWEAFVSKYQKTHSEASPGQNWRLIYKMDQKQPENFEDGYVAGQIIE